MLGQHTASRSARTGRLPLSQPCRGTVGQRVCSLDGGGRDGARFPPGLPAILCGLAIAFVASGANSVLASEDRPRTAPGPVAATSTARGTAESSAAAGWEASKNTGSSSRGRAAPVEDVAHRAPTAAESRPAHLVISAAHVWSDTGIDVRAGQWLKIRASGQVIVRYRLAAGLRRRVLSVGPQGTYLVDDDVMRWPFPLPAGLHGPAPCFALMARVGEGNPVLIGKERTVRAERSGRLYLGINDPLPETNEGHWHVTIETVPQPEPLAYEWWLPAAPVEWIVQRRLRQRGRTRLAALQAGPDRKAVSLIGPAGVPIAAPEGRSDLPAPRPALPSSDGVPATRPSPQVDRVVVFYLDGLRPDVVREMALAGHLPTIRKHFVEGGTWLANTFTAFPSDTITSNGTMWTGCFSDRHGLKGQVQFDRHRRVATSYLGRLGPARSARQLHPTGADRWIVEGTSAALKRIRGPEAARSWRARMTTDVPPLYAFLRQHGSDWATGILPIMTETPPLLWTRSLVRSAPYFHMHRAWEYIDEANTRYTVRHLLQRDAPVTVVWMPETDSASHKHSRGQFGATRRTIVQADRLIAEVIDELERRGWLERTVLMLVSDHGHHGGRDGYLQSFDLANDVIFRPREVALTRHGKQWVGGGLGLSVRQYRRWNRHPGDGDEAFVFIDGDADGAARLFLPRGGYRSGDWSGPNDPATLFAYPIERDLPPVNLVAVLARLRAWRTQPHRSRAGRATVAALQPDAPPAADTTAERGLRVDGGGAVCQLEPVLPWSDRRYCEHGIRYASRQDGHPETAICDRNAPAHETPAARSSTIRLTASATARTLEPELVVDLVLLKLRDDEALVWTADRGAAVIRRRRARDDRRSPEPPAPGDSPGSLRPSGASGERSPWEYQYLPVRDVQPTPDGRVSWKPDWKRSTDPFGFVQLLGTEFLRLYHDEATWLDVTAGTDYPDAVVAIARHLFWQDTARAQEAARAPDLVITCRRGWYFGDEVTAGTAHGYPFADSMRATWFVSGPGIARGLRSEVPTRLVDLTPTILDLLRIPVNGARFDGVSRRELFDRSIEPTFRGATNAADATASGIVPVQSPGASGRPSGTPGAAGGPVAAVSGIAQDWTRPSLTPVYWDDVDLRAWAPLPYRPVKPSPYRPLTVDRPTGFWDLNNLVFNALSVTDMDVVRLLDDVIAPLARRHELLRPALDAAERRIRTSDHPLLAALAEVLNAGEVAISDYSLSSLGNMRRIDAAVDWLQTAEQLAERRAEEALGRSLPTGSDHVHGMLDATQHVFWDAYRFVQRMAVQIVDEWALDGIEDRADRLINATREVPAEIVVR